MFKNTNAKTEIEYFEGSKPIPRIIFPITTLAIMKHIVDTVPQEVGWLGYVEVKGTDLIITDIYVPAQHVHGATCEIDEGKGLTDVCIKVMEENKDTAMVKFWGHSHGNGGVSPSGQDKIQSMAMLKDLGDFMIRAICNKSGEMSIAYYDNINKRIIENATWYFNDGIDRDQIKAKYDPIIKANVQEFTYHQESNGIVNYEDRGRIISQDNLTKEFADRARIINKRGRTSFKLAGTANGY